MPDTLTRPRVPACPACGALLSPHLTNEPDRFGEQVGWVCRECGVLCDLAGEELG